MKAKPSLATATCPKTMAGRLRTACAARLLPLLLFLAPPALVQAQYNFTTNNNTITITGYTGSGGAVDIPSMINGLPVISIGDGAFFYCASLISVTIGNSITSIGDYAFYSCTGLTNVTIGNNVTSIGDQALSGCSSLTEVYFQGNAPSVDSSAFSGANNATVYYLAGTTGWDSTFAGRPTMPRNPQEQNYTCEVFNDMVTITKYTGSGGAVTIPSTINGLPVTSIGDYAFWFCTQLTNVTILNSVTSIGDWAFNNCTSLTSVTIGNSVTRIGDYAFNNCTSLTSVTIPNGVASIGRYAFSGCSSLAAITVDELNSIYSSMAGVLLNKNQTTLIQYPRGKAGSDYTIPNSVTNIGYGAFNSCSSLTSVTIPNSVTSIGYKPFWGCTSLAAITVDQLSSVYCSIAGVLFNKSQTTLIEYPAGKAGGDYTIPNSVTNIGCGAFNSCTSLTSVTIPDSVTSIGDGAFYFCASLTGVYCQGNAPSVYSEPSDLPPIPAPLLFSTADQATVYYLAGTTGWDTTFGGRPTVLWNPQVLDYTYDVINGMVTITKYTGYDSVVTIPSTINGLPVTSIGDGAFFYCASLISVTIGNSTTSIGSKAFWGCTSLTNVTIPDSVNSIGDSTFFYCTRLTSITIPNSVTSIKYWAFFYCTSLTSVTIPNSVTSIGVSAFWGCTSLTNVTIANSVTSIGDYVFSHCNSLTSITIPNSVTSIGVSAFWGCNSLASITIGDSVTSIGDYAFSGCSGLTSVTIPNSVISIGYQAFNNCTSLAAITVDAPNSVYSSADGVLFNKSQTALIQYPGGKAGIYTIPNSITKIDTNTFSNCSRLTSVTIPNSVTSIGDRAFWGCTSLTSVTVPSSVTNIGNFAFDSCANLAAITVDILNSVYNSVAGVLFNSSQTALIRYPEGKGGSNYTIPNSVTDIGDWAFEYSTKLTRINIPNSVTRIGDRTFWGCTNLTNVTVPNSVTSIGEQAFWNCIGLTSVTIPNSVTNIGYFAFDLCVNLAEVKVDALNSVYSSADGVVFNKNKTTLIQYPAGKAGSYTIPSNVTNIGSGAFNSCTSLVAIQVDVINPVYTSVDGVLFDKDRTTLVQYPIGKAGSYTIPNSVTSIGSSGFSGCFGLTSVTIPNSVTSIGSGAFSRCTNLTSVVIGNSVTSISSSTFSGCSSLASVTIPNSATSIDWYAFFGCSSLTNVTIGNSVTIIWDRAFQGCSRLTGVYFKGHAPGLGLSPFSGANNATVYYLAGTTGWSSTFDGRPTMLWTPPATPQVQNSDASFGVRTNRFGFTTTGTSGLVIVVEACTDLANPTWFPLQTNTLSGDSFYFSDPQWTNYPTRFYRLRSP